MSDKSRATYYPFVSLEDAMKDQTTQAASAEERLMAELRRRNAEGLKPTVNGLADSIGLTMDEIRPLLQRLREEGRVVVWTVDGWLYGLEATDGAVS